MGENGELTRRMKERVVRASSAIESAVEPGASRPWARGENPKADPTRHVTEP